LTIHKTGKSLNVFNDVPHVHSYKRRGDFAIAAEGLHEDNFIAAAKFARLATAILGAS
jgi:hypothetical protein